MVFALVETIGKLLMVVWGIFLKRIQLVLPVDQKTEDLFALTIMMLWI